MKAGFDLSSFGPNEEEILGDFDGSVEGDNMKITTLFLNLMVSISGKTQSIRPFLLGGVGAQMLSDYKVTVTAPGFTETTQITRTSKIHDVSLILGGGLNIPLGENVGAIIEGKYFVGLIDGISHLPINAGLNYKL